MAKISSTTALVPSVLDRLLDDEPDVSREAPRSRHQVLRELKMSVRRDLELLLNTRRRPVPETENLDELDRSMISYGIPDFTGANMGSVMAREDFRATIQEVVRKFEPRFKTVEVTFVENADTGERTLRFRIDALLYADPAPEPVVFDTSLEPDTTNVEVKGIS